jgi:hypothetical protein
MRTERDRRVSFGFRRECYILFDSTLDHVLWDSADSWWHCRQAIQIVHYYEQQKAQTHSRAAEESHGHVNAHDASRSRFAYLVVILGPSSCVPFSVLFSINAILQFFCVGPTRDQDQKDKSLMKPVCSKTEEAQYIMVMILIYII